MTTEEVAEKSSKLLVPVLGEWIARKELIDAIWNLEKVETYESFGLCSQSR